MQLSDPAGSQKAGLNYLHVKDIFTSGLVLFTSVKQVVHMVGSKRELSYTAWAAGTSYKEGVLNYLFWLF